MRNNNIYYADYEKQLDDAGITPKDETKDILELIKNRDGEFYSNYRNSLEIILENIDTKADIKQGKKKKTFDDFLDSVVCVPIEYLISEEKKYPLEITPTENGWSKTSRNLPDDVKEEFSLLHWCYIEMETIRSRIRQEEEKAKQEKAKQEE